MKNNRFDDMIQGYIDGELNINEEKILKEHLKSCKECQKKLEEKKKIAELIKKTKEDVLIPKDLISTIIKETTERRIYRINWKYVTLGAAAMLIFFIILFTYLNKPGIRITKEVEKPGLLTEPRRQIEKKEPIEHPYRKPEVAIDKEEKESKKEVFVSKKPTKPEFEETRLVFPEDGSVVGEEFDVVIILEEPGKEIALNIDGEKKVFDTKNSNILYIKSDSLPVLENGIHYLSLLEPVQQAITFHKEG